MIVLAIDPGSVTAGYGILQKEGRKISYIASGILKFNKDDEFLHRVKEIYDQTVKLIEKYQPDQIALESLIFVKNPQALIKLAQSRGTMLAAFTQNYHQKVFEYSPNIIKATVTGHGHADKESIQKSLKQYFSLKDFQSHDESDAIAIALCHLLNQNANRVEILATKKSSKRNGTGLAAALAHKIKEPIL